MNGLGGWHGYTYRLGYQLIKEFKKTLLFRCGCPANGPCGHYLLDKESGKIIREFDELIFNSEDSISDFIIYFPKDNYDAITLHYINTDKKYLIKIPAGRMNGFGDVVPEYNFNKPKLENNICILSYQYKLKEEGSWLYDSIIIDLKKYKR